MAGELGFGDVAENSPDAVSNRDFVLDYLSAAATCATHLSQLGGEIVLWSSDEFGFCQVSDAFASGSSLMPQKKNPDAAELLRAKAPRVVGRLAGLHGVLHGLPLTYNKDLQEDKEPLFDAIDTLELCLRVAREHARRDRVQPRADGRGRLRRADRGHRPGRPAGAPGRALPGGARDRSAGWCARALERGKALSELTDEELAELAPALPADGFRALLEQSSWLESKVSEGGTAGERVGEQLAAARQVLARGRRMRPGRDFYARSVHAVARDLIGCVVRHGDTAGRIVETESYHMDEAACHAHVGVTAAHAHAVRRAGPGLRLLLLRHPRPAQRRGRARGHGRRGADPRARARAGIEEMRERRGLERPEELCSGPGKLTQALGIGLTLNGSSLVEGPIEVLARERGPRARIVIGERMGITKAAELPWRFCDAESAPRLPPLAGGVRRSAAWAGAAARRLPPAALAAGRRRPAGAGAGGRRGGRAPGRLRRRLGRRVGLLGLPRRPPPSGVGLRRLLGLGQRVGVDGAGAGCRPRCSSSSARPRRSSRGPARVAHLDPGGHEVTEDLGREGAAGHGAAGVSYSIDWTLVRVAHPHGHGHLVVAAHEPGVAVVLGGARLAPDVLVAHLRGLARAAVTTSESISFASWPTLAGNTRSLDQLAFLDLAPSAASTRSIADRAGVVRRQRARAPLAVVGQRRVGVGHLQGVTPSVRPPSAWPGWWTGRCGSPCPWPDGPPAWS